MVLDINWDVFFIGVLFGFSVKEKGIVEKLVIVGFEISKFSLWQTRILKWAIDGFPEFHHAEFTALIVGIIGAATVAVANTVIE